MASSPEAGGRQLRTSIAVAAAVGFGCMGVELTAVRLLAPWFGDSAYVWTNVIGVILVALALGAWFGGGFAERRVKGGTAEKGLAALLLGAAGCVAVAPLLAPLLGDWLLPQDMPLDAAMPALVRGSLVAAALLFAPPVWLLGALTPGLVVLAVHRGAAVGRAAGGVSAAGTIGSLVGTFVATHVLVPGIGCRATLWLLALVLGGAGVLLRRSAAGMATVAVVFGSLWLQTEHLRPAVPPQQLLAERESRYQYLRVVAIPGDDTTRARKELKINEGLDSFHSVAVEGSVFSSSAAGDEPSGGYYDYHAVVPLLAGDGRRPEGLRALSIGDAAGTFRRIYDGVHPGAVVDAVEIDPAAVELGEREFGGRRAPGRVFSGLDGRVFVRRSRDRWHAIHVDAYSHQVYIPAHLSSREFFEEVRERLVDGGVVACNVGGIDAQDPVATAILATMAAVFGESWAFRVPRSRNLLLAARRGAAIDPTVIARYEPGSERLAERDQRIWRGVLAATADPAAWRRFQPSDGGPVLVDDRPVLDELLHRSYVAIADEPVPVPIAGADASDGAEAAGYAALANGDPRGALAAVQRSRAATPYLRFLAGSARWLLLQLHGARAEYVEALRLQPADDLAARLRQQVNDLEVVLAPHERAEQAGRANGWWCIAIAALAAALQWLLVRRAPAAA